jgi:hypothetical protein
MTARWVVFDAACAGPILLLYVFFAWRPPPASTPTEPKEAS